MLLLLLYYYTRILHGKDDKSLRMENRPTHEKVTTHICSTTQARYHAQQSEAEASHPSQNLLTRFEKLILDVDRGQNPTPACTQLSTCRCIARRRRKGRGVIFHWGDVICRPCVYAAERTMRFTAVGPTFNRFAFIVHNLQWTNERRAGFSRPVKCCSVGLYMLLLQYLPRPIAGIWDAVTEGSYVSVGESEKQTVIMWTRKLCYRKDDRAMRLIHSNLYSLIIPVAKTEITDIYRIETSLR